jgi:aminoglycoside phosphotransferase family enzyme
MSDLPELVQALLNPGIYPDPVTEVEMMQTQMSFVFLTGEYVYKIKKPVDLGYLDYTTLQKRQFYCQREVELNRRLCPEVYLAVVAINQDKGDYSIDGKGKSIEYAVKMLYLPQDAMLNVLLKKGRVSAEMMAGVAGKLAEFHSRAATNEVISDFGDIESIITNTEENFIQTVRYIGNTIPQKRYRQIKDYTNGFIESKVALFYERIADGRIKDCHGDLHAAHICFGDDIYIYDCIEFNDRFRYCDTASEVAFLAMDLDNYGRADLSKNFIDAYTDLSGDKDLLKMLDFYKCYRAYVRGKVESFKLDDPHIPEEEKAEARAAATRYFELAESYTG